MAIEIVEFPIWNGIGGIILGGTRQTGSISIQAGAWERDFLSGRSLQIGELPGLVMSK